jgi:ATP-dependent Clp protease ATP-binding subunit ClpC
VKGYNFTDGVRAVLANAREQAARLHHEYVGTEHMLLGLLARDEGVAIAALRDLGIDLDRIRTRLEETVRQGGSRETGPDLPYTSRAKLVLELAMAAARELQHGYVGSEHLLLGMLREQKGIAAQVLADAGVTESRVREGVLKILGTPPASRLEGSAQIQNAERPTLTGIVVEMRYGSGWRQRREFSTVVEAIAFLEAHR